MYQKKQNSRVSPTSNRLQGQRLTLLINELSGIQCVRGFRHLHQDACFLTKNSGTLRYAYFQSILIRKNFNLSTPVKVQFFPE